MHSLSQMSSTKALYPTLLVNFRITNRKSKIDETDETELLQDYLKMQIWIWKISRVKQHYMV